MVRNEQKDKNQIQQDTFKSQADVYQERLS